MTNKAPSLRDVRATLATHAPDMTIGKNDCGEYRVTFKQAAIETAYPAITRAQRIEMAESLASYESDIVDAYETAKAMYQIGLLPPEMVSDTPAADSARTKADSDIATGADVASRRDNVEYHKGKEARAAGMTIGMNPYPGNPAPDSRWQRWNLGWHEGAAPADGIKTDANGRMYIDLTPTWQAVLPIFIAALESGTETGKAAARTELARMAKLADERNAMANGQ